MTIYRIDKKKTGQRGVAIVIVLGLIAVLMMMAVAFSIHMRIERTGAANYRYGVQARHMVYAGLANAISDIDGLMESASGDALIYPDWDVAASAGGSDRASVLSAAAAEYIPEHLREKARLQGASWNAITDKDGVARGRYAFVILNSSGLLDINSFATNEKVRVSGTNAAEIQLDFVPGVTDAKKLREWARADRRYETFPDLINNNPHVGDGRSFSMFSLTPVKDEYDIIGPIKDKVYIGGDATQLKTDKAKIITAFTECGVPNPDLAYKNLLDYVDEDSVPQDLAAGCVEKVPMINEFVFLYQITFDAGGNISGGAGLLVEWIYPFSVGSKETFDMHYDVEVTPRAGNTIASTVPSTLTGSSSKNNFTGGSVAPMTFDTADKSVPISGSTTNVTITVDFDIKVSAYIEGPDGRVDEVPSPYNPANGLKMTVTIPDIARGSTITATNSWECLDPRFNWVTDGSEPQWYSSTALAALPGYSATPKFPNKVTQFYFDPGAYGMPNSFDLDDDMYMFVADRPLESLGELGYLCYDWWRTIRLYEHQGTPTPYPEAKKYHTVLDKFTIWDTDYRRGLVNVNTTNIDILASVFLDMPQEEYSTNRLLTWAQAEQVAQEIVANRPYTNLSELGEIDWESLLSGPTEICKESGIRNASDLLTARDNTFTIIIRADSFAAGMAGTKGMSLATSRAVAEIWRDPIPDENGNHKCLIRSFRFVAD